MQTEQYYTKKDVIDNVTLLWSINEWTFCREVYYYKKFIKIDLTLKPWIYH